MGKLLNNCSSPRRWRPLDHLQVGAHDFNNKLQVIDGYVDLMLFDKDLPETFKQNMIMIKRAVDSSAELIKGMMVFSRKTPLEFEPVKLNSLIAKFRSMLARVIPKTISTDLRPRIFGR